MTATKPKWHEGPMAGYDLESTGVDVFNDRIITAAVVHHAPGSRPRSIQWLVNPGIPVPDESAAVHGWTTDRLTAALGRHEALRVINGVTQPLSAEGAIFEIAAQVGTVMGAEAALVAANAPFDLTMLESECRRYGIDPLSTRPSGIRGVIDPMVLEKQFDPYRRVKGGCKGGKHKCGGCGVEDKTLTSLCRHYGVVLSSAHDAAADALAALRLIPRLMGAWPDAARLRLSTLHNHQVTWRQQQADGLRSYFDKNRIEHDGVCGEWPLHTACAPALVGGAR